MKIHKKLNQNNCAKITNIKITQDTLFETLE